MRKGVKTETTGIMDVQHNVMLRFLCYGCIWLPLLGKNYSKTRRCDRENIFLCNGNLK